MEAYITTALDSPPVFTLDPGTVDLEKVANVIVDHSLGQCVQQEAGRMCHAIIQVGWGWQRRGGSFEEGASEVGRGQRGQEGGGSLEGRKRRRTAGELGLGSLGPVDTLLFPWLTGRGAELRGSSGCLPPWTPPTGCSRHEDTGCSPEPAPTGLGLLHPLLCNIFDYWVGGPAQPAPRCCRGAAHLPSCAMTSALGTLLSPAGGTTVPSRLALVNPVSRLLFSWNISSPTA